jgi:hypothetical protein
VRDRRARHERPEFGGGMIEHPRTLGVRGIVELEAPIEPEAGHDVRADAAPRCVCRVNDQDLQPAPVQSHSRREAGQPGPDDDYFGFGR